VHFRVGAEVCDLSADGIALTRRARQLSSRMLAFIPDIADGVGSLHRSAATRRRAMAASEIAENQPRAPLLTAS